MAVSREIVVAGAVGAGILGGAYLLAKSGGASPAEPIFAVTGPSEATARELIRANVQFAEIEATHEVDLADIYTSGIVSLVNIDSRERVALAELRTRESIAFDENETAVEIATIQGQTARFQAQSQLSAVNAQQATTQQKNLFESIIDVIGIALPFFF